MASDKAHPKKYSCKSCLKDFSSEFMLRKHNSYFHRIPDNPYKCITCNKTFPQLSELKSHVKVHTSTLKCGGCGGKVSSPEELKKHSLCWSRDCTVCGKAFDQIDELEAHSYTHTGEKPFKCSTCGDGFPSEELLQEHASSHTGPIFECSQCDAVFNEAMALKKHELNHLRPLLQTRVTCSWCGDEIKTKLLGRHRRLHKRQNSYECSVCQDVFEEPVLLKEHLSSHAEEESYICPVCEHYFTNVNLLKEHICISEDDMSDTYSEGSDDINDSEGSDVEYSEDLFEEYGLENDEDPYLWNDDYISEEQDLQNDEDISQELGLDHESVLENGENIKEEDNYYQDIDIDESVLPGEQGYFHTTNKTYICPLCFLKFTDLSDFNLHMEECSDDLLHTCSVCASGFPTENLLNDHSVPKKCPICCERFDCALLWKVHSYNHPEYGSYKCSLCNKQFQFRSEIMEHSLTHKSYRCPDCVTEFDTVIMLHRHACKARKQQDKKVPDKSVSKNHTMDQKTENQLPCPVCKTPFKSVTDFEEHMESHKEEKLVNCIFCGRFLPPFKRAHHIIACGKKKKRFFVDQDSTVKTTTASEPVVQATDGQSINSQTPSLEAATKTDESIAQKPDKEPIISDQYKETTETSNVKKPRKSSKKIQLCSKCGETFPDSKLLRLHMYDHIYKPCPNCGMVFALEKLKKHAVICTVKKVNNLEVKSSDFKKPAVIPLPIVNQQIHPPASRETVYKCSDCSMKCSSKSVLKEHSYLHKCYVRLEDCQQRHDKEKTHEINEKKVESATEDKEDEKDILKVKGNVGSLPTQEQESEIIKEIVESTFPTQDRTGIKEKEVESASLNQEKAGEIIEEQDSEPSLQIQEKEGNIIENKALLSIQDKENEITDKEHEPAILTEAKENETNKVIGEKLSIKIREKENEETEKVDPPSQTRKKKDEISKGQEPSPSILTYTKEDEITQTVLVESSLPIQNKDYESIENEVVLYAAQEKKDELNKEQNLALSFPIQEKRVESSVPSKKKENEVMEQNEHSFPTKENTVHLFAAVEVEPSLPTQRKGQDRTMEKVDKSSLPKEVEGETAIQEKLAEPSSPARRKGRKISVKKTALPTQEKEEEVKENKIESTLPPQKEVNEIIGEEADKAATGNKKEVEGKATNQEKSAEPSTPARRKGRKISVKRTTLPTQEKEEEVKENKIESTLPPQKEVNEIIGEEADKAATGNKKEVEGKATNQEKSAEPSTPARRKGRKISVKKTALPTQEKEEEVKENKIESTFPPQQEVNEIIGEEADKATAGNKKEVEGKATNQEKSAEPSTPARGKGKKRTVKKKTALPTQEKEDELKEKEIECTHPPQREVNVIIGEEADMATTANKKEVVVTIQEKSAEPSTPTRGKRRRGTMEKKATLPTQEKEDVGKDKDIECTLPPQKEVNETIREEADKAASLTANEKESEGDVTIQKKSNEPSNQARGKRSKRNVKKKTTLPTQEKEEEVKEKEIESTLPPQKEVNEIIGEEADKAATGNKKEVEEEATIQEKSAEPSTPTRRKRRRGTVEEKATLPTPEKEDEGNEKDIECTLSPQKEVNEMIGEEVEKAGTANKKEVEGEATIQEKSAEPSTPTRVMRSKRNVKKTTTLLTQQKEDEVKEKDIVCTLPPQREINAIIEEKPDKAVALTENEKESEGDVTLQEKSSEPPTPIRGKRSKRNVKRKTALATQEKEEEIKEKGIESTLPPQKEVNEIIGEKADKAPAPTENEKDMEEEVTIQEKSDEPSFQTRGKRRRRTVEKKTTLPAKEKEDVLKEKEIECTLPPQKEVNEMIGEEADEAASPAENEKEKEVTIQEKSDEPSTPARGKRRRRTVEKTTPPTQEKEDEGKEKEIECTLPPQKEVNEMIAGEADGVAFPTENEKEFKEEKEPEVSSLTKEKEVEIIKEKGSNSSLHACEEIHEMKQERVDEVAITNHETEEKIVKKKKDDTCFSPKKKRHKSKQEKVDGVSITPHENETLASPTEKPQSCSICGERFENLLRLRIHATIHKYESCALCGKVFIKERLPEHLIACIVEHFDSSEIAESLSSSRPDRNFVDVDASAEEERPTHPSPTGQKQPHPTSVGPTSHTCSACDMQFSELEHLEEHIRIHKCYVKLENCSPESSVRKVSKRLKGLPAGERHICLDCGIGFKESSDLWKHEDVHKMKPCSQCGELFSRREIREHSLDCTSVRPPKEGVSVSPCKKYNSAGTAPDRKLEKRASPSRSSGSTLSPHKANHFPANTDNVSQKCPQCDKQFDDEPTLKNHILITHEQNQVHTCSNCKMNFSQPHLLEEHRLFHKNCSLSVAGRSKWRDIQQKSEPASDDLTQSEKKPSICTCIKRRKTSYIDCRKCVKGFTDVGDLTDHVNKHSIWECSS